VLLAARRTAELEAVRDEIGRADGTAEAVTCDVTDDAAVANLAAVAREQLGRVDLLVNNAGREMPLPLAAARRTDAAAVFEVNVVALAAVTRAMLPLLQGGSAVVNVASASALRASPAASLYAASKGAVVSLTRSLAVELAGRKVRVNAVAPGLVRTGMTERIFAKLTAEQVAALEAQHPLGLGAPEDVAAAVCFLGSDEARWITGQTLAVDGGWTA
jgi:NAD(P)-dependent dehydrogenase (short-subunit alcohol dehydrogenase family)